MSHESNTPESSGYKKKPVIKPFDAALHAEFMAYVAKHTLSLSNLKVFLQASTSAISKYQSKKPEGDVPKLELKIRDFMLAHAQRQEQGREEHGGGIFETVVTRKVRNLCDTVTMAGAMGAIIGEPGIGKSRAIASYVRSGGGRSTAIDVELNIIAGGGTPSALIRQCMKRAGCADYDRRENTRGEWLIERLKALPRLLILDNAHLLTRRGLEWVLGFHDHTDCPVVLVGNSELHITLLQVSRAPSRVGACAEVTLKDTFKDVAASFLAQEWPEAREAVHKLAVTVLEHPGRIRVLRHVTRIAKAWHAEGRKGMGTPEKAFRAAMALQMHDYRLADGGL